MKNKKLLILIAVIVIVAAAVLGINNFNETFEFNELKTRGEYLCDGDWLYEVVDGEAYIVSLKHIGATFEVPENIGGYPVMGERFYGNLPEKVMEITVPESFSYFTTYFVENTKWYQRQPDGIVYLNNIACGYKGEVPENGIIEVKEGTEHIAGYSFYSIDGLEEIILPEGLITIGSQAFAYCDELQRVTIPESVTSIFRAAFWECENLEAVEISDKYIKIEADAFLGTSWSYTRADDTIYLCHNLLYCSPSISENNDVIIEDGTVSIADFVFEGHQNIGYIAIPESCTDIGELAFNNTVLKGFILEGENKSYSTDEMGNLYNKDKTVLIKYGGAAENKSFTVPETVKKICDRAFSGSETIEEIMIPDGLEYFGSVYDCKNLSVQSIKGTNQELINGIYFEECAE